MLTSDMDASSSGVEHLHYGTPMPSGGVHPITPLVRQSALTACQQEVERLQAEVTFQRNRANRAEELWRKDIDNWHKTEARTAELVEALEPFAKVAGEWDGQPAELSIFLEWNDEPEAVPNVLVEDFRRARAALGGQSNE